MTILEITSKGSIVLPEAVQKKLGHVQCLQLTETRKGLAAYSDAYSAS